MPGIDANTKLMLHLNGVDAAVATLDSSPSKHTITFNGTSQLDTAAKKWGTASLLLDGDSDYLTSADSADWDIFGSNSDSWTIDFWVKHVDHAGNENYLSQWEDTENYWLLYHADGAGLKFALVTTVTVIDQGTAAGEITDTNWHHIAFIKVANEYGLYNDGAQATYTTDDDIDTFAASLYIGRDPWGDYLYGQMDEIRIQHSNVFGAAPNATPDNTIIVPTREYDYYDEKALLGANF